MMEKIFVKAILFCNLPYAFSILKPLEDELERRGFRYIWYVPEEIRALFPYDTPKTSDIKELEAFESDMIFVPGNDVPWYLRGVKVQIFHGLAGEKKGHFRIRDYFDLYLTQGPYFTEKFEALAGKHKNFEVVETGWCKLDELYHHDEKIQERKNVLLSRSRAEKIILYAPTFSPSLSSAGALYDQIIALSQKDDYVVVVKFHDKMDRDIRKRYETAQSKKLLILEESSINDALRFSDLMISDTSSVVYEFLLLDKPVITFKSHSENILWENIAESEVLGEKVDAIFSGRDAFREKRAQIIKLYHPYQDGKSAQRMVDAVLRYIEKYSVPEKRVLPLMRKLKMIKKYRLLRW